MTSDTDMMILWFVTALIQRWESHIKFWVLYDHEGLSIFGLICYQLKDALCYLGCTASKRYNMHFKMILNPVVEGETPQNVDVVGVTTNKDLR